MATGSVGTMPGGAELLGLQDTSTTASATPGPGPPLPGPAPPAPPGLWETAGRRGGRGKLRQKCPRASPGVSPSPRAAPGSPRTLPRPRRPARLSPRAPAAAAQQVGTAGRRGGHRTPGEAEVTAAVPRSTGGMRGRILISPRSSPIPGRDQDWDRDRVRDRERDRDRDREWDGRSGALGRAQTPEFPAGWDWDSLPWDLGTALWGLLRPRSHGALGTSAPCSRGSPLLDGDTCNFQTKRSGNAPEFLKRKNLWGEGKNGKGEREEEEEGKSTREGGKRSRNPKKMEKKGENRRFGLPVSQPGGQGCGSPSELFQPGFLSSLPTFFKFFPIFFPCLSHVDSPRQRKTSEDDFLFFILLLSPLGSNPARPPPLPFTILFHCWEKKKFKKRRKRGQI
ncbi:uncharacterized protein [Taeniopygia guttata]|uniref:uncharacterized protein isoform X2 n=1 Tax=Taeniopygia guttata TaxID=59729 RepID=UPI003BB8F816